VGLLSLGLLSFGAFVSGAFVSWGFCLWGFHPWGFCLWGFCTWGFRPAFILNCKILIDTKEKFKSESSQIWIAMKLFPD